MSEFAALLTSCDLLSHHQAILEQGAQTKAANQRISVMPRSPVKRSAKELWAAGRAGVPVRSKCWPGAAMPSGRPYVFEPDSPAAPRPSLANVLGHLG